MRELILVAFMTLSCAPDSGGDSRSSAPQQEDGSSSDQVAREDAPPSDDLPSCSLEDGCAGEGHDAAVDTLLIEVVEDKEIETHFAGASLFTLVSGALPDGYLFDKATAAFRWLPGELVGPSTWNARLDLGERGLLDLRIEVSESNSAPYFAQPTVPISLGVGQALDFAVSATDDDYPENTLTYSLEGAPDGVTIDENSGRITGVIDSGPLMGDVFEFAVHATDNGSPQMKASATVQMIVGRKAPEVWGFYAAGSKLRVGKNRVGFLIFDPDPKEQLSFVLPMDAEGLEIHEGPKVVEESVLLSSPLSLSSGSFFVSFEVPVASYDTELSFQIADRYGFDFEHKQAIVVNDEPAVTEVPRNDFDRSYRFGLLVQDSDPVSVAVKDLNGHTDLSSFDISINTQQANSGVTHVAGTLSPRECDSLGLFESDNRLTLEIDDGLNKTIHILNFAAELAGPGIQEANTIYLSKVLDPSGRIRLPLPFHDPACAYDVEIESTFPEDLISQVEFSGAPYWSPASVDELESARVIGLRLLVRNRIDKSAQRIRAEYRLDALPRFNGPIPAQAAPQGSELRLSLPIIDPDINLGGALSRDYGLLMVVENKATSAIVQQDRIEYFPSLRVLPDTNEFEMVMQIGCPTFDPGSYEIHLLVHQNVNRENMFYDSRIIPRDPTDDPDWVSFDLTVTEAQPCSSLVETYRYNIVLNPPSGASLIAQYSNGQEFLSRDFGGSNPFWHFSQDVTLTYGRRIYWQLKREGQILKEFETNHYSDVDLDLVDFATINVPEFTVLQNTESTSYEATWLFGSQTLYRSQCSDNSGGCSLMVRNTGAIAVTVRSRIRVEPVASGETAQWKYFCRYGSVNVAAFDTNYSVNLGPFGECAD